MFLVSTFAGGTLWPYVASVACAVVAFFLLFLGFLRLRGSIRDAVAGSFLPGYFWLLSQLLFLPRSRDGLLQNASGQLVLQQFEFRHDRQDVEQQPPHRISRIVD
jgi:hypothetical protein